MCYRAEKGDRQGIIAGSVTEFVFVGPFESGKSRKRWMSGGHSFESGKVFAWGIHASMGRFLSGDIHANMGRFSPGGIHANMGRFLSSSIHSKLDQKCCRLLSESPDFLSFWPSGGVVAAQNPPCLLGFRFWATVTSPPISSI